MCMYVCLWKHDWVCERIKNALHQGTEEFPKLQKSVILDRNQDHYHLITSLYLNINSNRAMHWWKLMEENQKKETEDWVKLSL